MFYSNDVLFSRKGKLSVVWLLGGGFNGVGGEGKSLDKKGNWARSDALKLDLIKVCDEISSRLPTEQREHFSLRLTSYLLLGTARALSIRARSILADIRALRQVQKKRTKKGGASTAINVPERLLDDLEMPVLEGDDAIGGLDELLEGFRRNQAVPDEITMREDVGSLMQPPENISDNWFGTPPPSAVGETVPTAGLFEDVIPPVEVTAANIEASEVVAPDAPLRTNGIANPEDALETPAVEEDTEAGGRRRAKKRPPPPLFSESDLDETERPVEVPVANIEASEVVSPDALLGTEEIANPDGAFETPACEGEDTDAGGRRKAPKRIANPEDALVTPAVEEDTEARGRAEEEEAPSLELHSLEQPRDGGRPKKAAKRRKIRKGLLGKVKYDPADKMQVDLKANQETSDNTLLSSRDVMPQKRFPSATVLFATAAKKCARSDYEDFFRKRAREGEGDRAPEQGAADADIAMDAEEAAPEQQAAPEEQAAPEQQAAAAADIAMDVEEPAPGPGADDVAMEADVPLAPPPQNQLGDDRASESDVSIRVGGVRPLGQSFHRETARAGASTASLEGSEAGSIDLQNLGVSGIEASMLNPVQEEAVEIPVAEKTPQPEMNVEEEAAAAGEPQLQGADNDAGVMPPPAQPPSPRAQRSPSAEESEAGSIPYDAFDAMGPIEQDVMSALSDMGRGGRFLQFDALVADFRSVRSVARMLGLLLSMEKRNLVELKQETGAGLAEPIKIKKV